MGLLDPFRCSNIRCTNISLMIKKGRMKCSEKKRVRVGPSTEKPPQTQITIFSPKMGIADIRLVITVAPQKDICPHGSTYPKKLTPIKASSMITPLTQTLEFL